MSVITCGFHEGCVMAGVAVKFSECVRYCPYCGSAYPGAVLYKAEIEEKQEEYTIKWMVISGCFLTILYIGATVYFLENITWLPTSHWGVLWFVLGVCLPAVLWLSMLPVFLYHRARKLFPTEERV